MKSGIGRAQVESLDPRAVRAALAQPAQGRDWSELAGVEPAAVMLLLQPDPLRVITILRASEMRDHAGEVGFPGGKIEHSDAGYQQAALRETEEELGIESSELEVLGALRPVPVVTGRYLIYPFVSWAEGFSRPLRPCSEIARLMELPLADYLTGDLRTVLVQGRWRGEAAEMRHFELDGCVLYGASAAMLFDLLQRIATSLGHEMPASRPGSSAPWGSRYDHHLG